MENKLILITGATSGIGRATAELFAANGWNLLLTGRREERLTELKDNLQDKYSVEIKNLCFDIRDREAMLMALRTVEEDLSRVDVLLNNAGLALGRESLERGSLTDWETMIDTNVKGLIYITKEIIPHFIAKKTGHIINISSTAARDMYPGGNVYSATKSAVDALTKSLRLDLLEHNIKVSSIAPGMVNTEFSQVRFYGDKQRADKVYDGIESLLAEDIADSVYYIATRPSHVNIGDLLITCTAQANSNVVYRQ